MENRSCQLDVTKVARALLHVFKARRTLEGTVDGAHSGVTKAVPARMLLLVILVQGQHLISRLVLRREMAATNHCLRIQNLPDAQLFDLLWREQTELNLLDGLERSGRGCEIEVRHGCTMGKRLRGKMTSYATGGSLWS